ncbi:apolipoprotein N-acyltransferase [Ottowia sp.]|jgi:apolipoprotein N-acyltransferase|uniref:apolipoprotein N-acyltransferase n=1 Tax=Ottowia sp. TaxID=1898956 RepID=UPI0025D42A5B|nr:apolipoprotein N-acyltransferase [Ottowia sp.]MBK6615066.1 apolipoprotein N-acyltransferase [Ottowia sp.]
MGLARWLASPLTALAAGVAQALAIADPWTGQPHGWLQVLSLAVLVAQLVQRTRREVSWSASTWARPEKTGTAWRRGLLLGWLFGLGWLAGSFWWLFISMHTYGGLNAALAVAAVLALAGFLSLYYALACAAFMALAPARVLAARPGAAALLFAALWTLAELARGSWFTGFPWGAGGYAHVDGPLAAYARLAGVYGVGLLAAWLAGGLALLPRLIERRRWLAVGAAALAMAWGTAAPLIAPQGDAPGARMDVALLQGNIPQDQKFIPGTGVADSLRWYGEQWQASQATLVVAPETALPLLPRQLPDGYWSALAGRFTHGGQAALLGVPLGDMEAGYTNSVVGLAPGQAEPYRYDKHHLVPFGEFIPPFFRWFTRMMNIPLGDFARGAVGQPSFAWQGQRLAPNVCYEDLFGEELAARFANPATAPTAFVNVSNIAWFGDSVAIDQHLAISRMRALEFERPMLRATNTGATAIIDHRGRVTHQQPRLTRGVLLGSFEGRTGVTPYAWWASRLGLWPLWILVAAVVLVLGGIVAPRAAAKD